MKISKIYYTSIFLKQLTKIPARFKEEFDKQEKIFKIDPFDARLKTHKLKGKLKDYWAFSISRSHRIIFEFIKKDTVLFYKIGTHGIYK